MGLRRAVLEKVFQVRTTQGMFSDIEKTTAASASALTAIPERKGRLYVRTNAGVVSKVYLSKVGADTGGTATGTSGYIDLTP